MNCRCLARDCFSATRNTRKLAGTNDIATMMKIAMITSVPDNRKSRENAPAEMSIKVF